MKKLFLLLFCLFCVVTSAYSQDETEIKPIPDKVVYNKDKAELGKKLYHDTMLSADGTISCASCHMLHKGGVDGAKVSTGIKGQKGGVNSPTVYNSANNFVQFWDGRAKDLKAQALGPVENPIEMGDKWENVVKKVSANEEYKKAFDKIYAGKVTKENIADAIAEFETTLITPDSRFDKFLKGNKNALTFQEKKGYQLFQDYGCTTCHNGTYLGGNSYQTMNEEYFKARGNINQNDYGRFNVTKDEADKYSFKVPSLRNVALTAPYFHDGNVKTLDEAVKLMGKYQLGVDLKPDEIKAISAFLNSLTGKYQGVDLDKVKP